MSDLKQTAMQLALQWINENEQTVDIAGIGIVKAIDSNALKYRIAELLPIEREQIIESHSNGIEVSAIGMANNLTPDPEISTTKSAKAKTEAQIEGNTAKLSF